MANLLLEGCNVQGIWQVSRICLCVLQTAGHADQWWLQVYDRMFDCKPIQVATTQ